MKILRLFLILFIVLTTLTLTAQNKEKTYPTDSTGLPGDNFNLQGALDLFKNSATIEDFEKGLNTKNNNINNLDLTGDTTADYVKVIDHVKGKIHTIVLQDQVSEKESHDIAVIEIEQINDSEAYIQIVGDKEMYGKTVIYEPSADSNSTVTNTPPPSNNNLQPKKQNITSTTNVTVNVWAWPSVRYVYSPSYVVWVSPYRWGHPPVWYAPYPVRPWGVYYRGGFVYRGGCHYVYKPRITGGVRIYKPYHQSSPYVNKRYQQQFKNYNHRPTQNINRSSNNRSSAPRNNNGAKKSRNHR